MARVLPASRALRVDSRWYKDGALLTPGSKFQTLSEPRSGLLVLVIRAAGKEDLGLYECEVRGAGVGTCLGAQAIRAGRPLGSDCGGA